MKVSGAALAGGLTGSPTIIAKAASKNARIGVIFPFSGPASKIGDDMWRGLILAVEEINGGGGIKSLDGGKIELVKGDHEGKPEKGITEVEKLISNDVSIILADFQSAVIFPLTEITEKYKVPVLVCSAAADKITERGFKYLFRMSVLSSGYGEARARAAQEAGEKSGFKMKKLALLYENTLWGQTLSTADREWASRLGVEIVADIPYSASTTDLLGEITKIKASGADGLFNVGYMQDSILLTRTMYELDYNPKVDVDGGVGRNHPNYLESLGKLANFGCAIAVWNDDLKIKGCKEVGEKYRKRYNQQMASYPAEYYVAAHVVKDILERCGSVDREKIRKAFTETNLNPGEKGNIFPFRIKFEENGQVKNHAIIAQYINNKLCTVWPSEYASQKMVYPKPKWKDFA
jgi:branched-chain amino acid transport system substrate-binding protein